MNTDVILQIRLNSTRLPQKAVKILAGRPLFEWVLLQLLSSDCYRYLIIATDETSKKTFENHLTFFPEQYLDRIKIFVGDPFNVLDRYYEAASFFGTDQIIRATGDNPLVSPSLMEKILVPHLTYHADLSHFLFNPIGTGVEVFTFKSLEKVHETASLAEEKEHVTPFYYKHKDIFSVLELDSKLQMENISVTVDTKENLEFCDKIFTYLLEEKREDPPYEIEDWIDFVRSIL